MVTVGCSTTAALIALYVNGLIVLDAAHADTPGALPARTLP